MAAQSVVYSVVNLVASMAVTRVAVRVEWRDGMLVDEWVVC